MKRKVRKRERKNKGPVMAGLCKDLERAAEDNDTGRFYSLLKQIGISMKPTCRQPQMFTPEQGTARFEKISGQPNNPSLEVVDSLAPDGPNEILAAEPDDEEIWRAAKAMKASAPGDDEITIDMIRTVWNEAGEKICKLIRKMWRQGCEGEDWEEEACRAVVWLLWKRKGEKEIWTTTEESAYCAF